MVEPFPPRDAPTRELSPLDFLHSPRTPHLLRLWEEVRAFEVLPQLDRWLTQRFRAEKKFGQKDRRWYSEAIFTALRFGLWAAALEEMKMRGLNEVPAEFLSLSPSASWQAVRRLPPERLFFWLAVRDSADEPAVSAMRLGIDTWAGALLWNGVPAQWAVVIEKRIASGVWTSEQAKSFIAAQSTRPPLWLRLNHPEQLARVTAELEAKSYLERREGKALALRPNASLGGLEAFAQGWIEIQDKASQEIGEGLPLAPDAWVWDACAGGGGKTMQLAARLQGKGRVCASDIRSHKLKDLEERSQRARFQNISTYPWDGKQVPVFPQALQKRGGFDVALIDAPCTGAGTWRRNPDAKYRLDEAELGRLMAIQDQLLRVVSTSVRPGGYLAYATCSWLPAENEDRVAAFLQTNVSFTLVSQSLLGCPGQDADTMFLALLQRV